MALFSSFRKKRDFFTEAEKVKIVEAIRLAERNTSGEIRLFVETKNPFVNPIDRAFEVFFKLKMEQTDHRNAVLIYVAMKNHELAVFGDEGIHREVGKAYWDAIVKDMIAAFSSEHIVDGLVQCIGHIGNTLSQKFPFIPTEDKNELPDDIVFGN